MKVHILVTIILAAVPITVHAQLDTSKKVMSFSASAKKCIANIMLGVSGSLGVMCTPSTVNGLTGKRVTLI